AGSSLQQHGVSKARDRSRHHRDAAPGPTSGAGPAVGFAARPTLAQQRSRFLYARPDRRAEGLFGLRDQPRRGAGTLWPHASGRACTERFCSEKVTTMRAARTLVCFSLAIALGGCWSGVYENPAGEYVRRSDTIALNAGNAKDVNAATHVVDPWPRYVNDQRIPSNGERMVGAV